MAKGHSLQTNFTGGEISPLMMGRVDIAKFRNGASKIRNMVVRPQGGAFRRVGVRSVHTAKFGNKMSRIVTFEFSDEQVYHLEFGEKYIWFYKDGRPLLETTNQEIENWGVANNGGRMQLLPVAYLSDAPKWTIATTANNGAGLWRITTTEIHTFRTGVKVTVENAGHASINGNWTVTYVSPFSFDLQGTSPIGGPFAGGQVYSNGILPGDWIYLQVNGGTGAYLQGWHLVHTQDSSLSFTLANVPFAAVSVSGEKGHVVRVEKETPYLETDLAELQFAQSADVLYIAHPRYGVRKLMRLSVDGDKNDWLLTPVSFIDGPYLPLNSLAPLFDDANPGNGAIYPDVYLESASYTHTATVTAATNFAGAAADQNKYLEYRVGDQFRLAKLTSASSGVNTGTVDIIDNILLYMDESVKLTSKKSNAQITAGSSTNSANIPRYRGNIAGNPIQSSPAQRHQTLDPGNAVQSTAAAGTLKSQFSNTFGLSDVGKYIRFVTTANPPVAHWALIDGVSTTTGTEVHHATALSTTPGMVSNNTTGKFIITNEVRTSVVTSFRNSATYDIFKSTDVGRHIRVAFGGRWCWGVITTFTNAHQVTVTWKEDMPRDIHDATLVAGNQNPATPTTGLTYSWRLGAWSDTTGYPSCVTFHEQRLCFGRTVVEPQTEWGSRSGDYENFAPTDPDSTVTDDSAITYTIVSGKVSPIKWMQSSAVLLIGGLSQEWQVRAASSVQEPITPTNISVTPQTSYGSKENVAPQMIDTATIFLDRRGRRVREMTYSFELDRHVARDVSIVSEHLFRESGGGIASEHLRDPVSTYLLVLTDGTLACMTYERDHEVMAWYLIELAGPGAAIEAISVGATTSGIDEVYLVVKRTIGGVPVRFIEVIDREFFGEVSADKEDMPFLDSFMEFTLTGSTSTIEGLSNYVGEVLHILRDGVYEGSGVVETGGLLEMPAVGTNVRVGYNFESLLGILPIESGAVLGTAQVKTKRVNKVGVRVMGTTSFKHCTKETGTFIKKTLDSDFFTGDTVIALEQPYNLDGMFFFKQDLPEPMNILLVAPELATNEEQ